MKTTAEHFKRLLPTLQHLARFPHANREKICARDGVPAADVVAVLDDLTEGSPTIWDEDCLQEIAGKLGVRVPAYDPNARPHVAPPSRGVPAAAPAGGTDRTDGTDARQSAPSRGRESLAPNELEPAAWRKGSKSKACLAVARLLAGSDLKEAAACLKVGISQATWSSFKTRRLGKGPVDRAKLRQLLELPAAPAAPADEPRAKRKYTRRRLSKATAAPAETAAQPGADGPPLVQVELGREPAGQEPHPWRPASEGGKSLLTDLLLAQLTGARSTQVLGEFRLELDLRLVPIPPR